jgi:UDP-2-acetamido-2-deoxy-ribo-hexuluronate aminotransferase
MQFIDLGAQQARIREALENTIRSVLDHGRYIMGPEIRELEEELARYTGVRHAVGCSSGTDALLLALMALDIGPGDAVFTTPFTFVATAEAVSLLGATPVFVDIEPATFNMDPAELEKAVAGLKNRPGARPATPRAVIPVDLFGLPADYDSINQIAGRHGLAVIEDAAQSFGGEFRGRKACGLGDVGCTSFFPAKPLGAYGDGGMLFTDDASIHETLRSLLVHGQGRDKYENVRIGMNGRLDTMQAAVLLVKFGIFPDEMKRRQRVARRYGELLGGAAPDLILPSVPEDRVSAWAQYSVLARDQGHRTALQEKLKKAGVPTAVYYPVPLHLQGAFTHLGYAEGDFPVSEDCSRRIFSLPMHPYLDEEDQLLIAQAVSSSQGGTPCCAK